MEDNRINDIIATSLEKIKELSMDDLCAYVRGVLEKAL